MMRDQKTGPLQCILALIQDGLHLGYKRGRQIRGGVSGHEGQGFGQGAAPQPG